MREPNRITERSQLATLPSYLERSAVGHGGRLRAAPLREDVPIADLRESLIVEFYTQR